MALLKDMFLLSSFVLFQETFLQVASGDKASFKLLKFTCGGLFGFENKFDRDNELGLVRSFTKYKGVMVDEVFDFHADCM